MGSGFHHRETQGVDVLGFLVLRRRPGFDDHGVTPVGSVGRFFAPHIIIFILGCEKTTFLDEFWKEFLGERAK